MKQIKLFAVGMAALLFTACNSAENGNDNLDMSLDSMAIMNEDSANRADGEMAHNDDQDFIEDAIMGNMLEVEFGKIAANKATNPSVKSFAQKMVDGHSQANEKLIAIAQQHNVVVPTALDNGDRNDIEKLTEKSGNEFDKEYVDKMVDAHEKAVDKYEKAMEEVKDSNLKNYVTETLPNLKNHYQEIKTIQDQMK